MLFHGATNIVFDFFPTTNTIFSSPDLYFNIFKSMAYWTVAIIIIVVTNGRLGYSIKTQSKNFRSEQQVETTHA
jgi:hypothetical protein